MTTNGEAGQGEHSLGEYLSIKQLADRIPLAVGTIRNKICQGEFVQGYHYFKPSNGTIMFRWSRVVEWIESEGKARLPPRRRKGAG